MQSLQWIFRKHCSVLKNNVLALKVTKIRFIAVGFILFFLTEHTLFMRCVNNSQYSKLLSAIAHSVTEIP